MGHAEIQTTHRYLHSLPNTDQKDLDVLTRITGPDRRTTEGHVEHIAKLGAVRGFAGSSDLGMGRSGSVRYGRRPSAASMMPSL